MWLFNIVAYSVLGLVIIWALFKFYFWSRRLQKKLQGKWGRRFGIFFFFAPVIILIAGWCLPENWLPPLKFCVQIIDYTLLWCKNVLEPVLRPMGYLIVKPFISAVVYGAFGFFLGLMIDLFKKENDK